MKKSIKYQVMEFLDELSLGKKVTKRNPINLPSSAINDRFFVDYVSAKKELRNLRKMGLISFSTPENHSRNTVYCITMLKRDYDKLKSKKTIKEEITEILNANNRNISEISKIKEG